MYHIFNTCWCHFHSLIRRKLTLKELCLFIVGKCTITSELQLHVLVHVMYEPRVNLPGN